MRIITHYEIVASCNYQEIEHTLQRHIAFGWQPFGALVIFVVKNEVHYRQPIVKYGDEV